ncbi:AbiH family protein [Flammeovirga sp. OC4]|uniref:AbiH family protein n=1 Tax=Flammeovirga sp. OC4 TaxID=1382345 RepID=UPI0005C521F3|nr:AbiH family protein [Flammeovirga sp. OC4]
MANKTENKERKLVILGNGFDLSCGLRSSYSQFIASIFNENSVRVEGVYARPHVINDNLREENIRSNEFYELLLMRQSQPLSKSGEYSVSELFPREKGEEIKYIDNQNIKTVVRFKNPFLGHIIYKNSKNWVDIEMEYFRALNGEIVKKIEYTNEVITEVQFDDKEKLNIDLIEVRDLLVDYLTEEVKSKNHLIRDCYPKEIVTSFQNTDFLVVNFNYTKTLNLILRATLDKFGTMVNIHGELFKKFSDQALFGFGNEESDKYKELESKENNDLLKYIKSLKYQENDKIKKIHNYIDIDAYDVIVIGHSCGASDRTLLKEIFTHQNCKKIYAHYHIDDNGRDDSFDRIANISRCFPNKDNFRRKLVTKDDCIAF